MLPSRPLNQTAQRASVKWPPAPPTPRPAAPQDLEHSAGGGCHQSPQVQEDPWNLELGRSGQPWDGVPEGTRGEMGGGRWGAGGHSGALHGH